MTFSLIPLPYKILAGFMLASGLLLGGFRMGETHEKQVSALAQQNAIVAAVRAEKDIEAAQAARSIADAQAIADLKQKSTDLQEQVRILGRAPIYSTCKNERPMQDAINKAWE